MSQDPIAPLGLSAEKLRLLQRLRAERGLGASPAAVPAPAAADDDGPAPASAAQRRLWFMDRLDPGSHTYAAPLALRLSGPLDAGALARALDDVVARHEPLRTVFAEVDGALVQVVRPAAGMPLARESLAHLHPGAREARARERMLEASRRAFDLARGPVVEALLLELDAAEHLLVVNAHHVATDGWSAEVLEDELANLYGWHAEGAGAPPPPPARYRDWARREHGPHTAAEREAGVRGWVEWLADAPAVLELPGARPRPRGADAGVKVAVPVAAETARALAAAARARGASPPAAWLAVFALVLARWAGRPEVVVGTPLSGRTRPETERMIGCFSNTLPLRVDLSGDPSFPALVDRAAGALRRAVAHQDVPFDAVVEALRAERGGRHPVFQVLFSHAAERGGTRAGALRLERVPLSTGTAKFDLSLEVVEGPEGARAVLEYAPAVYQADVVERLAAHLAAAARAAAARPGARASLLGELPPEEQAALRALGEGPAWDAAGDTLAAAFARQCARTPDAVAVSWAGGRMTYAELDRRSARLAAYLAGVGVRPGELVGLGVERSADAVAATLAIVRAGAAYLPLEPSYPAERLRYMLEHAGVRRVVTTTGLEAVLPLGGRVRVRLDADAAEIAAAPAAPPPVPLSPESLAYVMFTSGSTGRPKGVMVPHRGVLRLARSEAVADFFDAVLHLAPASFDVATLEIWAPLLAGGRVVLYPPERPTPAGLGRMIREEGARVLFLTAGLLHAVADEDPLALEGAATVFGGGDTMSPPHARRLLERVPGLRVGNGYGPTEDSCLTTTHPVRPLDAAGGAVPIGRPLWGTRVYVVGGDGGLCPGGVPGELCIGGAGLAHGYLGRPGLTAAAWVPDPFSGIPGARLYRTGDRARWRPDGLLDSLGRMDAQVKVRGFRVEPGEVEAVLAAHPAVRQAVVRPRGSGADVRLVAWAAAEPGETAAALREWMRVRLPEHMVPRDVVVMERLPLTDNGKVDRAALPEPIAEAAAAYDPPATATEHSLAALWAELLQVERVGRDDDFFALGGHSLLATRMVARLRAAGAELPLSRVFENSTLAGLAAVLEASPAAPADEGPAPSAARRGAHRVRLPPPTGAP